MFRCPVSWAHGVRACDLNPCPYSDHAAIVLKVSPTTLFHGGPGRWKLNQSILRDPVFVSGRILLGLLEAEEEKFLIYSVVVR